MSLVNRYSFDVRKCMFSPGNITEKIRVAEFDCKGEIVIDLYAGVLVQDAMANRCVQ